MSTDRLALVAELVDSALLEARTSLAKAERPYAAKRRTKALDTATEGLAAALAGYFSGMADRILPVAKAVAFEWDPDDADWATEGRLLRRIVGEWWVYLGEEAYGAAGDELGFEVPFDIDGPGVKKILAELGDHVTAINDATREALRRQVSAALERGYSLGDLVRGNADDGFDGLRSLVNGWSEGRAMTIARTETATAHSLATVAAYRDSGVVDRVEVLDGTGDAECAEANGQIWTLEQAAANPIAHPNCVRAFAPVVSA